MSKNNTDYHKLCRELIENPENLAETQRLHRLFDLQWEWSMVDNPIAATFYGYPGYDDKWPDCTLEGIERSRNHWRLWQEVLDSISSAHLPPADVINYDLYKHDLSEILQAFNFPFDFLPLDQMGGPHQMIADVLEVCPNSSLSALENILGRLAAAPEFLRQNMELMKEGVKLGVTPPAITLRNVPQQIAAQITDDPADAPVLRILASRPPEVDPAGFERVVKEARQLYVEKLKPAFERFLTFFNEDYLPHCRQTIACSDLPNGRAWYEYLVRSYTTTKLTPDEIYAIGESEVIRIRAEMDEVIRSSGFEGSFEQFLEFLRTDPQFYFEQAEDLVKEYRNIAKRADPELAKLFGRLPMLPYGVIPIPDYAATSQTTAYYQPGSLKAGRPGYYYVNTYNLKSRPKWEMEALTLHEAVPGHHLQMALAQELEGLPKFRTEGWVASYGEGWALYAESLGQRMGFYTSSYSKFGQLAYQMWRAVRLVVDVGLHQNGWSRQKAIDYVLTNTGKTEHDVTVEVDRYIVWPGQALAYKIGELKIKELRKYAETTLGDKFDIRQFHDAIHNQGPLPLEVLASHIRKWVTSVNS